LEAGCITCKESTTSSAKRQQKATSYYLFDLISHLISVSTIRAAVDLKQTFDQISAAEKSGKLSPEEKRKLEESAAEKVCYAT
jgi:hypothetical protein